MSMPASSLSPYNSAVTTIYPGRRSVGLLQTTASKHLQNKTEAKEWNFLRNNINTQKLFEFLSQKIVFANYPDGKDSCDRFTDGWLQYMFDPNCGYILVGKFQYWLTLNTSVNIWVAFGTGKNYKYLSINSTVYGALVNKWTEQTISRIFRMEAWWEHMHAAHGYLSTLTTASNAWWEHMQAAHGYLSKYTTHS